MRSRIAEASPACAISWEPGLRGEAVFHHIVTFPLPRRTLLRRGNACDMSNDSTRQHLLGTWKLIAAVREEISSGTKTDFLGQGWMQMIMVGR